MYPPSSPNEKEEYFSDATTPSDQTPPSYPSPHPKEFDFQPGTQPHHNHYFGPQGFYNPYFSPEFGYAHGGYMACPPPPPPPPHHHGHKPHHHGCKPHPKDPFFFEGKHQKKPKKTFMRKVLIATGVAFAGFVVFTMGRGYQFTMMQDAEMHHKGVAPHHRGAHMHHVSGEGMVRGNGSHTGKFDENHHGAESKPDYRLSSKPHFKPLDDPHGPPSFPDFGKSHEGEPHRINGPKGKHHKEPQGDKGDLSDDRDIGHDLKKQKRPHGDGVHRGPDGPWGNPHKKAEGKKQPHPNERALQELDSDLSKKSKHMEGLN
ncbi:hypothetical protein JCM33374_g6062 [Metschnikowia sp. JCM 33374]|nr:hypothetical protein JCM33374_g6062 [Metschnikowia sp. JCM 33374]